MALVLTTHSSLLRTRFPKTRNRLLGSIELVTEISFVAPQLPSISVLKAKSRVKHTSWVKAVVRTVLLAVVVFAIISVGSIVIPEAYTRLVSDNAENAISLEKEQTQHELPAVASGSAQQALVALPPQDSSLPEGTWIKIPSIGVDTQVLAIENSDEALQKGAWMVPDFGRPGDSDQPTIMAAHRFGWKSWWKTDFGKLHSFYSLDKTQPGDRVEVIYDHRLFTYEIYAGDEGEEITDYSGDLILYTCKFLNSPARYFRYLKLVPPSTT